MKIKGTKPKNRWYSPTYRISGINRETLSLILCYAKDGIEHDKKRREEQGHPPETSFDNLLRVIDSIEDYINDPDGVRLLNAEEIEDY